MNWLSANMKSHLDSSKYSSKILNMKEPQWIWKLLGYSGIFLTIVCLSSCNKTDYELQDPETAGVWTQYKTGNSEIPGDLVWDIERDGDDLWVSFLGEGVGVYNNGSWTFYNSSNSGILNDLINDLEINSDGDMLMGTGDGLCVYTKSGEWLYLQDPVVTMDIKAVKYTSEGATWLGTDGEGFYVDWGSGFFQYKFTGCENVYAIEEDSHGDVWLGTSIGLWRYNGSSVALTFNSANGLPEDVVSTLFFDSNNRLWIGTDGGETVSWLSTSGILHQFSLRNGGANYIRDIYEDRKGDIWFATWFDGLVKYDGVVTQLFKEYNIFKNTPGDLIEDYVNCIGEDNKGNMWFGMFHNGLIRYSLPLE
jgi:ligand-binding sensor domain-containing protein